MGSTQSQKSQNPEIQTSNLKPSKKDSKNKEVLNDNQKLL